MCTAYLVVLCLEREPVKAAMDSALTMETEGELHSLIALIIKKFWGSGLVALLWLNLCLWLNLLVPLSGSRWMSSVDFLEWEVLSFSFVLYWSWFLGVQLSLTSSIGSCNATTWTNDGYDITKRCYQHIELSTGHNQLSLLNYRGVYS